MSFVWQVVFDVAWRARSRAFKDLAIRVVVYSSVLRAFPHWLDVALVLDFIALAYLRDLREEEYDRESVTVAEWRAGVAEVCLGLAQQVGAIGDILGLSSPPPPEKGDKG